LAVEIRPLSSHTGAEVLGVDLTRPVSEADRAAMNRAFVERSVLVIRGQTLKPSQVVEAVGLFGAIFPQQNSKFAIPDCPQIHYVSNQDRFPDGRRYIPGEGWHTDHSNAVTRSTPTWPPPMTRCRPPPSSASPR
jgi:taurine dioxygenase